MPTFTWELTPPHMRYDFRPGRAAFGDLPYALWCRLLGSRVRHASLRDLDYGPPQGRCPDLAGPEPHDLVDLARRTRAAHGCSIRLVPTWSGVFGLDMAGDVLLPGPDARIAPTTFDDWLAGETISG